MKRRRRIWTELLPAEELGDEATITLLERFGLEPLVALPPDRETEAMSLSLRRLAARGLQVGVWPLLEDRDGYWPSETNVEPFIERVEGALRFTVEAGAPVRTLAIDLEPPLDVTKRLMSADPIQQVAGLGRAIVRLGSSSHRTARESAIHRYRALVDSLERRGIETLAAVVAPLVLDLASGAPVWQWILRTPIDDIGFSVISPMLYTTEMRSRLPFTDAARARGLLHAFARLHAAHAGNGRASVSLGLVSTGKLGDESCFRDPAELLLDVEAARAAGIDDLALFSLEGILKRGAPERWLTPFSTARPRAPKGASAAAMSALVRAFAHSLGWVGSCIPPRAS